MIEVQCLKCVDQYVTRRYCDARLESKLENLLVSSPKSSPPKPALSPQRYGMADRLAPKVIGPSSILDESDDLEDSMDHTEPAIAAPEVAPAIALEDGKAIVEPDPVDTFKGANGPQLALKKDWDDNRPKADLSTAQLAGLRKRYASDVKKQIPWIKYEELITHLESCEKCDNCTYWCGRCRELVKFGDKERHLEADREADREEAERRKEEIGQEYDGDGLRQLGGLRGLRASFGSHPSMRPGAALSRDEPTGCWGRYAKLVRLNNNAMTQKPRWARRFETANFNKGIFCVVLLDDLMQLFLAYSFACLAAQGRGPTAWQRTPYESSFSGLLILYFATIILIQAIAAAHAISEMKRATR